MPSVLTISWLLHQPSLRIITYEEGAEVIRATLCFVIVPGFSNDGISQIRLIGDIFQRYFSSRDEDRIGESTLVSVRMNFHLTYLFDISKGNYCDLFE